jgi:hypothetical protein
MLQASGILSPTRELRRAKILSSIKESLAKAAILYYTPYDTFIDT